MGKKSKSDTAFGEIGDSPSFEDALDELQQIVVELEEGTHGLEESIQRFEKAMGLLRGCYRLLQQAEQKIELLTGFDEQGNPTTVPFDASATLEQSQPAAGRRKRPAKHMAADDDSSSQV